MKNKIVAQTSVGSDNYRLSVRDLDSKKEFILSNPASGSGITSMEFERFENLLNKAETEKKPITILYIKKFSRKFINDIDV
jgi:hypothetical protein